MSCFTGFFPCCTARFLTYAMPDGIFGYIFGICIFQLVTYCCRQWEHILGRLTEGTGVDRVCKKHCKV